MYIYAVALHDYMQNILCSNRRLHSILQGVSCNMIEKVADSDMQNVSQAITENPQWLSKVLVRIYSGTKHRHAVIYK